MLVLGIRLNNDSGYNRRVLIGADTLLEVVAQDRCGVTVSVLSPRHRFRRYVRLGEGFELFEAGGRVSLSAILGPGKVRLGFDFPPAVRVLREELVAPALIAAVERECRAHAG